MPASDPASAKAPSSVAADDGGELLQRAKIDGQPLQRLPQDLYIPPDALEIFLEAFEGPLDLLLYLIRRQNLDILNIPVKRICDQYIEYIALMREMRLQLAAEYLVMAAWLAEIKSRMLLPKPQMDDEEDEDPRAELVRRLQEYERFKTAAESLDGLPREGRDTFTARVRVAGPVQPPVQPPPGIDELLHALREVMLRADLFTSHQLEREPLSVRERMTHILSVLESGGERAFFQLFQPHEGRSGVVVTFVALLELIRASLISLRTGAHGDGPRVAAAQAGNGRAPSIDDYS